MQEEGGESQRFTQPVHHIHFQFCACWAGGLFKTSTDNIIYLDGVMFLLFLGRVVEEKKCGLSPYPGESNTVDGIGQHVTEHRGPWSQTGVVGMHVRALPVNHLVKKIRKYLLPCRNFKLQIWWWIKVGTYSWHDDFLDVIEDILPVLRLRRRSIREQLLHVTWFHIWNHPPLPDGAQVLCDVVHQLLTWSVTDTVTAGMIFPVKMYHSSLFFLLFTHCWFAVKYNNTDKKESIW